MTLLDTERSLIIETLALYNGNKLKAAKHLGLTWPSLDRRCKKLGIEVRKH
jgi:transcriptional regulator with GAF, ATPase, and Fis domain